MTQTCSDSLRDSMPFKPVGSVCVCVFKTKEKNLINLFFGGAIPLCQGNTVQGEKQHNVNQFLAVLHIKAERRSVHTG